jgi:hypothetical protein
MSTAQKRCMPVTQETSAPGAWLLHQQQLQHSHDQRNHHDIHSLSKADRLKHYGLHFCKYVGRLARGVNDPRPPERTIVDTFLVSLSAANTLHQDLSSVAALGQSKRRNDASLEALADAAGRFADACEKIDHLEEFVEQARDANCDVIRWVLSSQHGTVESLVRATDGRREELKRRQFYIPG